MKIKWEVPINALLYAPKSDMLFVELTHNYKGILCTYRFLGDDPEYFEAAIDEKYMRTIKKLEIIISDLDGSNKLFNIVSSVNKEKLFKILIDTSNRFIRSVRNFGLVAPLKELSYNFSQYNYILLIWSVEILNEETWMPLLDKSIDRSLLFNVYSNLQSLVNINMMKWNDIEEAMLQDITPSPEIEFTTNALEHLINKNYRYAVVESIIGLEIVLTRFLTKYLTSSKGFSSNRVKDFLSTEFGLYAKLSGLLDLILNIDELQLTDLEKVKSVVKWRNHIVHRTGHLPEGVSKEQLLDGVENVISLITILGYKSK
ncbi:hypothetical protein NV379_23785 [Paenibacillus sp. N1-5-1-14]|uniref:hypothetical protein n=1 Tax=Paenibacillus radicibacter TaxID=2972488 RepID=UPI0021598DC9|nr:hypothetical protein [Paenibacillus radicibacter]MCR8645666.1 hypothetical protein [Paenibacillus radicibacter]